MLAGCDSPTADARTLLGHVTGATPAQLLTMGELSEHQSARYLELIAARARRIPLQHLTGRAWFRNVSVAVGPGVFIPRPETELVAGAAIDEAKQHRQPLVVELCAGSGAISAAVLDEVADARVVAIENQPEALTWLRRNLPSGAVRAADIAAPQPDLHGRARVVVANPPYVGLDEAHLLPKEVLDHDPHPALFAGPDGMAVIPTVIQVAARLLAPAGLVVIEHGDEQATACLQLLGGAGFDQIASHRDLAGRARYVTGRLMGALNRE